jgi:hypothetical protein
MRLVAVVSWINPATNRSNSTLYSIIILSTLKAKK